MQICGSAFTWDTPRRYEGQVFSKLNTLLGGWTDPGLITGDDIEPAMEAGM